jgi:hypothetical protein
VLLALAVCLPAAWQLGRVFQLYLTRVDYPWDIEWLESTWLYEAHRIRKGQGIYLPLDNGYLAQSHPPGYPAMLALLGGFFRLDYPMARTLSLVCFLVVALVSGAALLRNEEDKVRGVTLALLAAGIGATGAGLTEGFYDLVRADMFAWALCAMVVGLVDVERMKPRRIALVAVLMAAVVYTRLPAVFVLCWVNLFVLFRDRRAGLFLALSAISLGAIVLIGLQLSSGGWFWMYVVSFLQKHHVRKELLLKGIQMVYGHAPFIPGVAGVAFILALRRRLSRSSVLWLGALVAALPATLLPLAKLGGFVNDLIPVALFVGPATLLVLSDAARAFERWPKVEAATYGLVLLAAAAFTTLQHYDLERFEPTQEHHKRAARLNELTRSLEGGVLTPRHPFLAVRMGHTTRQFNNMAYLDAWWTGVGGLKLGPYIERADAEWLLSGGTEVPTVSAEIAVRYQLEKKLDDMPVTIIGERSQMKYLLRRREKAAVEHVLYDFEDEGYQGWKRSGEAFEQGPTSTDPGYQAPIFGASGLRLANSFHPKKGDKVRGVLVSPEFVIDLPRLGLSIGGGGGVAVELKVMGRIVERAYPVFTNQEVLIRVVWDVSEYIGLEAQLQLRDSGGGSWSHLLCDDIVLYLPAERVPKPERRPGPAN